MSDNNSQHDAQAAQVVGQTQPADASAASTPMPAETSTPTSTSTSTSTSTPCEAVPAGDSALIALARATESRTRFLKESLRLIGQEFGGDYAVLYARLSSQVIDEYWHGGTGDPGFWKDQVGVHTTNALKENKAGLIRLSGSGAKLVALGTGLLRDAGGSTIGVVGVVVNLREEQNRAALYERLTARLNLVSCLASGFEKTNQNEAADTDQLVQLGKLSRYQSLRQLAFAITNNLRNKTACDQVALGLAGRGRVKILSISGFDTINERSPAVASLREAMEECLDAGMAIGDQASGDWERAGGGDYRLHRQWRDQNGGSCVASFPVIADDGTTVVLSLARGTGQPFDEQQLEKIREILAPHVGAFGLIERSGRSLIAHGADAAREGVRSLVRPSAWVRKAWAAAVIVGVLWFCFGTWAFHLPVAATVEPAEIRHVTAASQGMLSRVYVNAGDAVKQGDMLCEFDHAEMVLERQRLAADFEMARLEEGKAVSEGKQVEAQLAQARQQMLSASIAILDERISRMMVRAPFDGVVVAGDLRESVGQNLSMGHPLFELAVKDRWKLELSIPESMSDEIEAGLSGAFVTNARPDERQAFEITRITPTASAHGGENVYQAEASVLMNQPWMRRGVEGQARIDVGRRKVWWVALHKVIDYLRLNFWL